MGPMQFASETYSEKRLRYRLAVDPYEPPAKAIQANSADVQPS
jgi:hypothetical protein